MCILVLKKKGVKFPSEREIINCIKANPDGFALTYNRDGKLVTFKTLYPEAFLSAYKKIVNKQDYRDTAMMLHMRIATHGSVKQSNCHCWHGTILGTEMSFAHNGILRIANRADLTDSETFLRDYLEPCTNIAEFMNNVETYIGASKFGFMDGDGNVFSFGHFNDYRGVMYSNWSFRSVSRMEADPRYWSAAI